LVKIALHFHFDNSKKLITKSVIHRHSFFSKATGLMFHKKILDEANIFYFDSPQHLSLTMFFVFFPIDVVFVRKDVVVELKKNFRPFSNFTSKQKANLFIELPNGFVEKKKIIVGSKIIIN